MGDRLAARVSQLADWIFGPVFTLDATRVGRRFSTFVIRWLFLLILVSVLAMFFYSWRADLPGTGGNVHPSVLTRFAENFFWVYAITQFLAIVVVTPGFNAAAITDEKERKTLHFLLVTDLSGREIVFGKLASRVGALLTLVIAGLPIVSFMQFFGGIEPRLLLVTVSMTLATVLSLSAVSVASSVLMAKTRDAVLLAYTLPILYIWLSYHLPALRINPPFDGAEWLAYLAAGNPILAGRDLNRSLGIEDIPTASIWYVGFHLVVTILGIAFAGFRIRRSVNNEGAGPRRPRGRLGMMIAWAIGRRGEARKHPPVGDDPMYWREVHVEPGSNSGLFHKLFALGILAAIVIPFLRIVWAAMTEPSYPGYYGPRGYQYYSRSPWKEFQDSTKIWVCAVTCGLGLLMILRAAVRGASSVASERDRDTWTSLIGTPLSVGEILRGKWAGCFWGQKDAAILLGIVWSIGILTGSVNAVAIVGAAISLGIYLWAFGWLGVSCSVTAKSSRAAIGRAVPTTLLLVGGYWFVLGCCCAGIGIGGGFSGSGETLAQMSMFICGMTPTVVLALMPAINTEFLGNLDRWRDASVFFAGMAGWVLGTIGWGWLAVIWSRSAHTQFAREANRVGEDQLPGSRRVAFGERSRGPEYDWDVEEPT